MFLFAWGKSIKLIYGGFFFFFHALAFCFCQRFRLDIDNCTRYVRMTICSADAVVWLLEHVEGIYTEKDAIEELQNSYALLMLYHSYSLSYLCFIILFSLNTYFIILMLNQSYSLSYLFFIILILYHTYS